MNLTCLLRYILHETGLFYKVIRPQKLTIVKYILSVSLRQSGSSSDIFD